jgi:tagaturonate epimerase
MTVTAQLHRFSFGIGDRFGRQAASQLQAVQQAKGRGIDLTPVWNKSYREHSIVGTHPRTVRDAADRAVAHLQWTTPYFVDADHITLETVDLFLDSSDFFTIDVANRIDRSTDGQTIERFAARHPELSGVIEIEGLGEPIQGTPEALRQAAGRFLGATMDGRIYRHIRAAKAAANFLTEVSMDETSRPQTPYELLVILAALADERVPVTTIAPRFRGRFNKGVDYVGDVERFERDFDGTVALVRHAVSAYGLPASLKLSIHSGSDKFPIYPAVRRVLRHTGAGVHVKTAGTTWLEELIGLAETGGENLALAKGIYRQAPTRLTNSRLLSNRLRNICICRPGNVRDVVPFFAGQGGNLLHLWGFGRLFRFDLHQAGLLRQVNKFNQPLAINPDRRVGGRSSQRTIAEIFVEHELVHTLGLQDPAYVLQRIPAIHQVEKLCRRFTPVGKCLHKSHSLFFFCGIQLGIMQTLIP